MTQLKLFQILALSFLGLLLLRELFELRRPTVSRGLAFFRSMVWLAAALAIAYPNRVTTIANKLNIDRGADLVSYLFILSFLMVTFYFYSRYVKLQRQITQLVRHLAIQEARRGGEPAPVNPARPS